MRARWHRGRGEPVRPRKHARLLRVLGSIRTRLAVFFFLITLIAVSVVYVYAVPSLQSKLEQQELTDVQKLASGKNIDAIKFETKLARYAAEIANPAYPTPPKRRPGEKAKKWAKAKARYQARKRAADDRRTQAVTSAQSTAGVLTARTGANAVWLLQFHRTANGGTGPAQSPFIYPWGSSAGQSGFTGSYVTGAGQQAFSDGKPYPWAQSTNLGLVAIPIANTGYVFVYSVTFGDVHSDVILIGTRILVAAAIALAVVLLLGVLVARALTVRVLRLERAAQRVAQGDLSARFRIDSNDELGQLAAALAHMQSQLAQLEQARRRFIATASHELRTPIFSLGGFLELIQDEDLDEETRRVFVGQVREQVERLGRLATGLLDLSRLEAGSVELDPTPTDIGVLSRAVAGEFLPALALHGSELELELPEAPLRAVVDPERVAQLLRILIDNAITHTPAGTLVTVGLSNGDGKLRLSVADGGPGIADEVVQRIFEPFYTAEGTRGAGLGLAIARELAERLNGTLDVSSGSDGTVFTLTLMADTAAPAG